MKKSIFLLAIIFCIGCKKKIDTTPHGLDILVSGLTSKTSVSIAVVNNTYSNVNILNVKDQYGDNTFSTLTVGSGDQLTLTVTSNYDSDASNNGVGTITYSYNGKSLGTHGGAINKAGFSQKITIP